MNEIDFSGFFFGIGFANFFCRENAKIRIFMNGVEKMNFYLKFNFVENRKSSPFLTKFQERVFRHRFFG